MAGPPTGGLALLVVALGLLPAGAVTAGDAAAAPRAPDRCDEDGAACPSDDEEAEAMKVQLLQGKHDLRRKNGALSRASGTSELGAGRPGQTVDADLLGVHDLLLLGYWGVMTRGPHTEDQDMARVLKMEKHNENTSFSYLKYLHALDAGKEAKDYEGLMATRDAAIDLAHLLPALHPVRTCRESFEVILRNCSNDSSCDDEKLITRMAAESWECVGIKDDMIIPTCHNGRGTMTVDDEEVPCKGKPITTLRTDDNELLQMDNSNPYSNYRVEGIDLGVCWQGKLGSDGYPTGKTKWLRACSYWTAFHTMALRADALGGEYANLLLRALVPIVSGGALWCGG